MQDNSGGAESAEADRDLLGQAVTAEAGVLEHLSHARP